jgi:hypothetical protein
VWYATLRNVELTPSARALVVAVRRSTRARARERERERERETKTLTPRARDRIQIHRPRSTPSLRSRCTPSSSSREA